MLSQLVEKLDLNSPFDAAVSACATTAFWGQCHLGKLLPISATLPPLTSLPTQLDFKKSLQNPCSYMLHLPQTKTHHHGQDIVLVDQHAPINLVSLLKNHLQVNASWCEDPIFSFSSSGTTSTLIKSLFLQHCNTIWSVLGYSHTTGHCFQIRGMTELLIAGILTDVIRATSCCYDL